MRRVLLALAVLTGLVLTASPAGAITNGVADGTAHPNVGGLVNDTQFSDGTWLYCSGTLIAPTVFLTAAHCGEASPRVRVTFDSAYEDGDPVYSGTFHADPAYPGPTADPHDVAVVVLDKAVKGIAPARLPQADSLSGVTG